jgi:predicted transcriptional regulator
MAKEIYHPNACVTGIRNVKRGLRARTKILNTLEKASGNAKTLAKESELPYSITLHHLKLLRKSGVVHRRGSKPYVWTLTGFGQKRLAPTG